MMFFVGRKAPSYAEDCLRLTGFCSSSAPPVALTEDDHAAIYFSSGTTGFPKAILHPHLSLAQAAEMEARHHETVHDDVFLCIPPLYHTGAKFHWMGCLTWGARAVLLRGVSPQYIFDAVSREHCTEVWLLVPWVQDILAAIERGDLSAYLDYEKQIADLEVEIEVAALEERARIRRQDVEDAKKAAEAKAKVMQAYAAGVGDVLGAIADLYDASADDDKRSFENSKRFQIAETWVNTLSGMASAIWATWNDKTIPSAIAKAALAATNAAGVLASGIATTAKIRSTQFGGGGSGGSAIMAATAPAVNTSLPQMLQAQTASDVDRLNRAAEPSRVYILQSDIQAAGRAQKVRVAETTF